MSNVTSTIEIDADASTVLPWQDELLFGSTTESSDSHSYDSTDFTVGQINFWIMLFGIIGNTVCLIVFMQKPLLNRKFNWYLIILACAELLFCSIVWANYLVFNLTETKFLYDLSVFTCIFTDYFVYSMDAFCVFLTLTLSIDRLYAIMNPLKSRSFITYRNPRRIALFIYFFLLIVKSPELLLSQRLFIYSLNTLPTSTIMSHTQKPAKNSTLVNDFLMGDSTETITFWSNLASTSKSITENASSQDVSIFAIFKKKFIEVEYTTDPNGETHQRCTSLISFDENQNTELANAAFLNNKAIQTQKKIYIIYCNIFVPLILNIIPAISILILNMMLWIFIRRYIKQTATNKPERPKFGSIDAVTQARSSVNPGCQPLVPASKRKALSITQKSHYFTIIIIGIWLLITSTPYYTLNTYYWITTLRFIEDKSRAPLAIQAISSTFFNSNHCLNIIIYLIFHKDFRAQSLKLFFKLFNINPFVKLNPQFLKIWRLKNSLNGLNNMAPPSQQHNYSTRDNQKDAFINCGGKCNQDDKSNASEMIKRTQSSIFKNSNDDSAGKSTDSTELKRNSSLQSNDDQSLAELENVFSQNKLFIPNEKLFFFKFFKKERRRERSDSMNPNCSATFFNSSLAEKSAEDERSFSSHKSSRKPKKSNSEAIRLTEMKKNLLRISSDISSEVEQMNKASNGKSHLAPEQSHETIRLIGMKSPDEMIRKPDVQKHLS